MPTCPHRILACAVLVSTASCIIHDGLPESLTAHQRATAYEAVYVHRRASELYQHGQLDDAIAVERRALELLEGVLGAEHAFLAAPARNLAAFYQIQGSYAKAEPLYARVITIQEHVLGSYALGITPHLDELAALYMQWGAYDKAQPLYARALQIRERALGSLAPAVIENLNQLALTLERQGMHRDAEALYNQALANAEQALGPAHADVARSLDGLAMVYWSEGTYARAEPMLVRALEIREQSLAQTRHVTASGVVSINNMFHPRQSQTKDSNPNAKPNAAVSSSQLEAKRNRLLVGAPFSLIVHILTAGAARRLSNLDQLDSTVDPDAAAQPLIARAGDVYETLLRSEQSSVADNLDRLAGVYAATGDFKRAEPLLVRTIAAREAAVGKLHPDVANSLNNLALLYQARGEYANAEPLLLQVLRIREHALGARHAEVARSLNNLALLYESQGNHAKAEPLLVRAISILEAALGKAHPDVARCLNNLALLYHDQGSYSAAEPLYLRALDIVSSSSSSASSDKPRYLNNLAFLYYAQGDQSRAESIMARAVDLQDEQLQTELARLSAPRKRGLMQLWQRQTESLVSLHADSMATSARAFELALATVLRRKGLALESSIGNRTTLRGHLTPYVRDRLARIQQASAELSRLSSPPVRSRAAASAIASLRSRIDDLESQLNTASAALRAHVEPVTPERIQRVLPPGAALVEIVRYHHIELQRGPPSWGEARYVAYVLKRQGPSEWVALGPAAPIEAAVDAMLAAMHQGSRMDETAPALHHLDELVFEPLRSAVADASHLIISPDGKLNLVPFEALRDAEGSYELEHRLISYVTSGRDLLQFAGHQGPQSPATIIAAPDYGPGKAFARLDGTTSEAIEVSAHLPGAVLLTGKQATKSTLAGLRGPAVLHVATHGFFAHNARTRPLHVAVSNGTRALPGVSFAGTERDMFIEGLSAAADMPEYQDPSDALDRAALALADANTRPDGIVTAREIASYDWWGTQLVVLSACETGVGAVPSGDGVYGLRRALTLAGAEAQVVSLWNVGDSSARALMRELYTELEHGTGRADALRRAKLRMLQSPDFSHPYYWAAFIHTGAWSPLGKDVLRPTAHKP